MSNRPIKIEDEPLYSKEVADKVKLLSHIRKTPNMLYGLFIELVRQLYADDDNFPIDVASDRVWCDDASKTGIWIDADYIWDDESPEMRPAIYVKLSAIEYKSKTGRHDGLLELDLEQGERIYSRSGHGRVSFVHIGRTSGEETVLAGSTLDFIDAFGSVIRDDFCFDIFKLVSWQPTSLAKDEADDRFRSTVVAEFAFEDVWRLKLEGPKLKRLIFNAGQALLDRDTFGL